MTKAKKTSAKGISAKGTSAKGTSAKGTSAKGTSANAGNGMEENAREIQSWIDKGWTPEDVKAHYRKHYPDRIRTYTFRDPGKHSPVMVRRLRTQLGMSQAIFAKMIGVSTILVQSWERGVREPSTMARRLLDTISRNPVDWVNTVVERKAG
jgi:DNA-binding transcriptional regulator YiaG